MEYGAFCRSSLRVKVVPHDNDLVCSDADHLTLVRTQHLFSTFAGRSRLQCCVNAFSIGQVPVRTLQLLDVPIDGEDGVSNDWLA